MRIPLLRFHERNLSGIDDRRIVVKTRFGCLFFLATAQSADTGYAYCLFVAGHSEIAVPTTRSHLFLLFFCLLVDDVGR